MSIHFFSLKSRGDFVRSFFIDKETKQSFEEWHRVHEITVAYVSATEIIARTADQPVVIARYATLEEADAALPIALDLLSGKQTEQAEAVPMAIQDALPAPADEPVIARAQELVKAAVQTDEEDIFDENGLLDPFKAFDLKKAAVEIKNDFDVSAAPIPPGAKKWLNR